MSGEPCEICLYPMLPDVREGKSVLVCSNPHGCPIAPVPATEETQEQQQH